MPMINPNTQIAAETFNYFLIVIYILHVEVVFVVLQNRGISFD
jgi:hypothetical protein